MPLAGSSAVILIIGCLLLLVALLGAAVGGERLRTANATRVRILVALIGVVLVAAPFVYRASHLPGEPAQSVATPPSPPAKPDNPLLVATAAIEKCPLGSAPTIPDAATATREQMLAARAAFQTYDAATKAYAKCVDDAIEQVGKQFPDATTALQEFATTAHNTAINQEQAVANDLNAQLRAYKAKHPTEQ